MAKPLSIYLLATCSKTESEGASSVDKCLGRISISIFGKYSLTTLESLESVDIININKINLINLTKSIRNMVFLKLGVYFSL